MRGLAVLAVVWMGCGGAPLPQTVAAPREEGTEPSPPLRNAFAAGRHRGACFAHSLGPGVGYGTPAAAASLGELRDLGVDWVSITPFGFLAAPDATEIRVLHGESDERLRAVTAQAHALGLRVLLKPHLWLRPPHWPGDVSQRDEAGWAAFFAAYREFVLRYATLGREADVDALLVGNELVATSGREAEWRELIAAARREFPGPLGYGANHSEAELVPFWDALDFIGVSAYYPLVEASSPSRRQLVEAWGPILDRLGALSRRWGRRVVFTEVGYPAADWAAWTPWATESERADRSEASDPSQPNTRLQADAFAAFLEAAWPRPWVGGAYWWKWFSADGERDFRDPFAFRGRPAADVVRAAWTAPDPRSLERR